MLNVSVVTPAAKIFDGDCSAVTVPGAMGQLQVLPGHDMLLTATIAGLLVLKTVEGTQTMIVGPGFVEVSNNVVSILTNSIQDVDTVDKAAATVALKEGELALAKVLADSPDANVIQKQIEMARAQLQA